MKSLLTPFLLLLTFFADVLISPVHLERVQSRHIRPTTDKCDRNGRCTNKEEGYIEETDTYKQDDTRDKPTVLIRDEFSSLGGSTNQKPKPIPSEGEYDIKVVSGGYDIKSSDDYVPKPAGGTITNDKADGFGTKIVADVYKPERGSDRLPQGNTRIPQEDRKAHISIPDRDIYDHKSITDSDDHHKTKPPRGGYSGYDSQPNGPRDSADIGGHDTKPDRKISISLPDRDDYDHKPTDPEEYKPKPPRDVYGDYDSRPIGPRGSGYDTKPEHDKDPYVFRPKPSVHGGEYRPASSQYDPKPDKDQFVPRPAVSVHRPRPDRRPINPVRKDMGGYNDPKEEDSIDKKYPGRPHPVKESNCICVPYYQCQEGHIVTDGAGIIDARKRPEPEYEDLPLDGKFKPPSCGSFHVCCNTPESSTVQPYEHRCGVRNPSGINSRILSPSNKGEADFGEWPWQAAVLKSEGKINIFQCGGVLIDKHHVLTVAHCVYHLYKYNSYPLKVRLGEWDTQTTTEFLAHEDYHVSKILVHPEFRNTSLWNDIAILRLEEPVLFAPHIDTVCLPQYDDAFADHNCVVTGWGKDAYKGGTFSNVMKEVALQVIDDYKCEEMLRKTRLGRFFQLHEGFMCAGGEYGLDSCKGDGGGPLVCYRKDKSYALAGIVSWGIDCGQPGVPGVYTKIQKFLDWISKNTGIQLQEYWPKH